MTTESELPELDPDLPDLDDDNEDGHHHFEICPPEGAVVPCPDCAEPLDGVAVCTIANYVTALPCEHTLTLEEFESLVKPEG